MIINGREIGPGHPPYIIAEASCNHCSKLEYALSLINVAKEAGADAIKFQCYTPETITIKCDKPDFIVKDGPWKGRNLYDLYAKTHTPYEWFPKLFEHARKRDITIFSSVFDPTAVDLMESLDSPAYKIASMEITDVPLIRYTANTDKPIILSTGMASDVEVFEALEAIPDDIDRALLHCVSGYPTPVEEAGLSSFVDHYCDGISDHSQGWMVPVMATALGANIIEKHLMLHIGLTEDEDFSLNPRDFGIMCKEVRRAWKAMQPSTPKSEESSRQARRSLYVVEDIRRGEVFTEKNIRSIRPSFGLPPKDIDAILGKWASQDIERGTALSWNLIQKD
jgi:pseudaminic acid synthase